jgi:hypothetical protein
MTEIHPEKRQIGYAPVSTYEETLDTSLSSFAPPNATAGTSTGRG